MYTNICQYMEVIMKPIIGIVSCGYMERRQFVPQTYIQAVEKSGGIPLILPCTHDEDSYGLYGKLCGGFLFCGGDDITPLLFGEELKTDRGTTDLHTDRFHIRLMQHLLTLRLPVLAICRGMQVLNIALGGTIFQDISLRRSTSLNHMQLSSERSDPCHRNTVIQDSMLSDIFSKTEYVNSFHHQCIHQLGEHLKISAAASDGIIEAIELEDHPFAAGVQWHPECMMDTSPSMANLFRIFIKNSKYSQRSFTWD